MPLDARARRFLDMIAVGASAEYTVEGRREGLRRLALVSAGRPPEHVESRDISVRGADGPLAARLYGGRALGEAAPGLVFFHGGGFVSGDLDTSDTLCRCLAAEACCRVVSVAYRLAPEHPFPAAIEDGYEATAWAAENASSLGIDPLRLGIAGSSAGGGIAARVCQEAAVRDGPALRVQLLLCPVLDAGLDGPSRRTFANGYLLDAGTMRRDAGAYGSDRRPADPRASPLRAAALAGLPQALIHTAEYDPVGDDGAAYAARLSDAGTPVKHSMHAGMIHEFYAMGGLIPSARSILAGIGAQVGIALSVPVGQPSAES